MGVLVTDDISTAADRNRVLLKGNDADFAARVYSGDFGRYARRIAQYGLEGRRHVLDAGAGVGQWTIALAAVNDAVTALELDKSRVAFIEATRRDLGLENIDVIGGSVTKLPFADGSFDAVFCYGVLEQTPWKMVLSEFARVLAPNGILYLNANGVGWYRFLWDTQHNRSENYDPKSYSAKAFANTITYERGGVLEFPTPVIISPDDIATCLAGLGIDILSAGGEGSVIAPGAKASGDKSFFLGEYKSDPCVHEIIARRTG
jgi:SAM-dependent methyltransferase